jgi:hypothetical protein
VKKCSLRWSPAQYFEGEVEETTAAPRLDFNIVTATILCESSSLHGTDANLRRAFKEIQENGTPVLELFQFFLDLPNDTVFQDVKMLTKLISDRFDFFYVHVHGVGHLLDTLTVELRWTQVNVRLRRRSLHSGS